MRKEEYSYLSTNQINHLTLIAYIPNGQIKGFIQIVHDSYDHIERYEGIMKKLCEKGYLVFGNSIIGHDTKELGMFYGDNIILHIIDDIQYSFQKIITTYSKNEENISSYLRCLLGVGFGSAICKAYLVRHQDCNAFISCGDKGYSLRSKLEFLKYKYLIKEEKDIVTKVLNANDNTLYRTNDMKQLKAILANPYCTMQYDRTSYKIVLEIENLMKLNEWIHCIPEYLPIYIMSGLKDPLNNFTRDLDNMIREFRHTDAKNIFFKYYENSKHELLFDVERDEVKQDILIFLKMINRQIYK